jgi:hypothetical protein
MGHRAECSLISVAAIASSYKAASLGFILTELDMAATLCGLALSFRNKSRVLTTMHNANLAVQAALRARKHVTLTRDEQRVIADRMNKIKAQFDALREKNRLTTAPPDLTPRSR